MNILLKENERIDDLEFKNLKIIQNKNGFCFGIDSILLTDFAKEMKPKSKVIDLGTGTGIIPILLSKKTKSCNFIGCEIQKEVALMAERSVKINNLENQIEIHHEDALTIPLDDLKYQEFDCLFIDAAKAQYQKFFEKYMPLVKEKGICIVDNLDFHGMIFDIDHIKNRNTKQLVKKIKRFKDWIFNHDEYQVTYYGVGDGICVIKRK